LSIQSNIKQFYNQHSVPNPVNLTLTEKQLVNGQKIDDLASEQNLRHFRNILNTRRYPCLRLRPNLAPRDSPAPIDAHSADVLRTPGKHDLIPLPM
jgi:hypothetical protein